MSPESTRSRALLALALAAGICVAALAAGTSAAAGPPAVTTGSASAVASTSVTVAGTVNPNGLDTTWSVQYGTTTGYGLQTNAASLAAGTQDQAVEAALTGLRSGTAYHYRLIGTNSAGTTVGSDMTFTTAGAPPPPAPPPTASTRSATSIGRTAATLRGGVNPRNAQTTYFFEYGLTNAYGSRTGPGTLAAGNRTRSVSARLNGLQAGTTYHYRLVAQSQNGITPGKDHTVTTRAAAAAPRPRPAVSSSVRPRRDRRAPYRFRVRGRLVLPGGVTASACRGRLTIRFTRHGRTVRRTSTRVHGTCSYSKRVTVRVRTGGRARALRVAVRFRGNTDLRPKSARTRIVRAG